MLVDSHCHLDFDSFDDDRADVLARATEAGVGAMVTICTRVSRFDQIIGLTEGRDGVFCSVGNHPHQVEEEDKVEAATLVSLTDHPKVVGIGETGLDYYYDHSPRPDQQTSFRAHIAAARDTGLPVIVHTRDADNDMGEILRDEYAKGAFPGVLHCFSSGRELSEIALEIGFYISLSGILTFNNASDLRDIAADLPMKRLLVETDAPYLAPMPMRGKRNEPAFVAHTAARLAKIKGLGVDEIERTTSDNFFRLFAKAERPVSMKDTG